MNPLLIIVVFIILLIIVSFTAIVIVMYYQGGIYRRDKHSACALTTEPTQTFCDIRVIDLVCPPDIKDKILSLGNDVGRYVSIPKWKGGRTLSCSECIKHIPQLIHFYHSLTARISTEIGSLVTTTPLYMPTSCAVLIYEKEDDFINWHYDVNYYSGRFFTLLIPVSDQVTCTKFVYKNGHGKDVELDLRGNRSVLFEGEHVFHMASKLCKNELRVIISMQFVTLDSMTSTSHAMTRLKDIAFIGTNGL